MLPLETLRVLAVTGADTTLDAHASLARVAAAYPDELLDVALRLLGSAPVVPVVSRLDEHQVLGVVTLDDVKRAYKLT